VCTRAQAAQGKVTKTVFMDITEGGEPMGRIEIGLFGICPARPRLSFVRCCCGSPV